jgi:protein-S-isoprenylcysteine O-methyltransferase Ste14
MNFSRKEERLLNVLLCLFFAWGVVWAWPERSAHGFGPYEISLTAQNTVFCLVILLRRTERELSFSVIGQFLASAAFFSGLVFLRFIGEESGASADFGRILMIAANVLAVGALLNLGRSFGILIARRRLKTRVLYGIVRHPMYLSDITLRLGYCLVYPSAGIFALAVLSAALYAARAAWEEKFLSQREDYRLYCQKVRWRFIPFVY